ncbi:MAG: alpha/beta fold hydrolase [Saprospiraceae bacterium]
MRILLRAGAILLLLFFISSAILTSCMTFRKSDAQSLEYFNKRKIAVKIHRKSLQDREIRYLESSRLTPDAPLVVFVHGAPGSAREFHTYLADSLLLTKANLVSIDRPGYGYSGYGKSEPSLEKQTEAVCAVVESFPQASKVILVGHSYGGPIVAKCAMMHPDKFAGIMMLAPVNDPNSEKVFWYAGFAKWKLTRWMLSKAWRVSGDEKFAHIDELKKMENDWSQISVPIVHIHGAKDKMLAPQGNITFSKSNIPAQFLKLIVIPDTGHLIPWTDYDQVKTELLALLNR